MRSEGNKSVALSDSGFTLKSPGMSEQCRRPAVCSARGRMGVLRLNGLTVSPMQQYTYDSYKWLEVRIAITATMNLEIWIY